MRNVIFISIVFFVSLASCDGPEPRTPYVYESNPNYTYGFTEFYGAYYTNVGINQNVLSLSLYSDTLKKTDEGNWYGQLLYFEDVFLPINDSLLTKQIYIISSSNEPYTIAPGRLDTIDKEVYNYGAIISYYEQNSSASTTKLITEGTVEVKKLGLKYLITCDLKTSDHLPLTGTFINELKQFDEAFQTGSIIPRKSRFQKHYK